MSVHSLQTSSEGSLLDPDDTLSDVVDDREQVSEAKGLMFGMLIVGHYIIGNPWVYHSVTYIFTLGDNSIGDSGVPRIGI